MKPIVFPTRRRSTSVKRFLATCDFLIGCSFAASAVVLAGGYVVMRVVM